MVRAAYATSAAVVFVATLLSSSIASAAPYSDQISAKRAEAARVSSQVTSLNNKVEIAAERYNEATDKLERVNARIKANDAKLRKQSRRLAHVNGRLDSRAASMYEQGPLGYLEVILGANTYTEFAANWELMTRMNEQDATLVHQVKDLKAQTQKTKKQLASDRVDAREQVAARKKQKAYVEEQLAKRKELLASVGAEIRDLVAKQAAAEAAAAAARSREIASSGGGGYGDSFPTPSIPAHGSVVDYARSRIGAPYVWAADGPSSFDCSGLMMWCYAKIGISLPHSSREQINVGQRVSQKDLQPGDLVFFGSPIHHVGMYIGNGQMIEAPYTGSHVRIANAFRGDYAGACRP